MTVIRNRSRLLRRALIANAVFSAISGLILIVAAHPLASLLGLSQPTTVTGISLLCFAVALYWNARRVSINRTAAWVAVVLDAAWVAGSLAIIFAGVLTTTGNWMVALTADIVLLFAILQFVGLVKLRTRRQPNET